MSIRDGARQLAIRVFRSEKGQRLLDGIASRVDLWRGYGAGAYVPTSGERVLFELVRERVRNRSDMVIFDVGANVGEFANAALDALGNTVAVHAFEPARETFQKLSERFVGNPRVILNNVAIGRESTEHPLYGVKDDSGKASFFQRTVADDQSWKFQENVRVIRLSDYCASKKVEHIDLLKMDVEGAELDVLAGAEPLFDAAKIDICSFEFGGCNLDSRTFLRDFFEFFHSHGLKIFRITPAATIVELPRYHETLEKFTTTNYVAMRR
jgi:FkbM family methyltransferase